MQPEEKKSGGLKSGASTPARNIKKKSDARRTIHQFAIWEGKNNVKVPIALQPASSHHHATDLAIPRLLS